MIFSGLCVRSSHGNNLINLTNFVSMKGPLPNKKKCWQLSTRISPEYFTENNRRLIKYLFFTYGQKITHIIILRNTQNIRRW